MQDQRQKAIAPYADACDHFLSPDVTPDLGTDFEWERPNIDGIVQYLFVEKGFDEERVRN